MMNIILGDYFWILVLTNGSIFDDGDEIVIEDRWNGLKHNNITETINVSDEAVIFQRIYLNV